MDLRPRPLPSLLFVLLLLLHQYDHHTLRLLPTFARLVSQVEAFPATSIPSNPSRQHGHSIQQQQQQQPTQQRIWWSNWSPTVSTISVSRSRRLSSTTRPRRSHHFDFLQPLYGSRPQDLDISFGSHEEGAGVSWGDSSEDEEMTQRSRDQATVRDLLDRDEDSYQRQRKLDQWGDLVTNVTNTNDLHRVVQKRKEAWQLSFEQKAMLAKEQGVQLELLAPPEDFAPLWENENVQIRPGSMFYGENDGSEASDDLSEEWQAITENDDATQLRTQDHLKNILEDVVQQKQKDGNQKLVPRDALQGVRVGSAGGWTLEVFPGDFVVHRKYGIGKFERTCLRSKTKLTPAEKEAQSQRRAEILTQKLRELQSTTGKGVTPDQIQEIRSVFGTEEDTDPISNPQATVLEIAYQDAVVHVPVDRAYRLSRYRAGDALVQPKLSRVRSESWRRAREKVEANTLELAQDVLALYATRETLARPPFDPQCEELVKEFEKSFLYEPTPDQKKCFEDVENDMVWRSRPMDRLVCGDVGFGKTEVALRAIFRSVANGRQAALLAPTGVLAAQHFKQALARMGPGTKFNLNVGLLRGGMGPATRAGRELRQQIADGTVQIIVGTQSLLSNELKFHDLGLLVIDEVSKSVLVIRKSVQHYWSVLTPASFSHASTNRKSTKGATVRRKAKGAAEINLQRY